MLKLKLSKLQSFLKTPRIHLNVYQSNLNALALSYTIILILFAHFTNHKTNF